MMRKYGWKKDVEDPRDYLYKVMKPKDIVQPEKVDLRALCSTVEDQGALGSCTANALAAMVEYLQNKVSPPKKQCWLMKIIAPATSEEFRDLSRLFVYYNERMIEGTIEEDSGAMLRDGIKVLNEYGWCGEKLWPYDISKFAMKPSQLCYDAAVPGKISSYQRLLTQHDMLDCLAEGYPFAFGIRLYESFQTPQVARTGIVPMPQDNEQMLGGHAVCAVGYDKSNSMYLVRNSWGEGWGIRGYFKLPFAYIEQYGDDFWTIRNGSIT